MLSGYKTYIFAGITVITAVATYLVGEASLADTIQVVVTAVLGVTIRHGIAKK